MDSQTFLKQYQEMGDMPDFRSELAQLYEKPVLRPLTEEAANLESQYLTSLFEPFTKMGTGAADLSPAAKLAGIGGSLGRLSGRIGANQSIQNFYGAQIQDLANRESEKWKQKKSDLMNMYQMAFQREEAERAERARQAALAAQQQALNFAPPPAQPGGVNINTAPVDDIVNEWKYMVSTLTNMTPAQKLDHINKFWVKSSAFKDQFNQVRQAGYDPQLIFKQLLGI